MISLESTLSLHYFFCSLFLDFLLFGYAPGYWIPPPPHFLFVLLLCFVGDFLDFISQPSTKHFGLCHDFIYSFLLW